MTKLKTVFFWIALLLGSSACADQAVKADPQSKVVRQTVPTQVFLRPWNTKGFGKLISEATVTVITSPEERGDMVILRWEETKASFIAEVYRPDDASEKPDIWNLVASDSNKSIVRQPSGTFHLSELISGADGGSKIEVFKLRNSAQAQ